MENLEVTVSIGDTIQLGEHYVTVCDIDDGEIIFRVESDNGNEALKEQDSFRLAIPR